MDDYDDIEWCRCRVENQQHRWCRRRINIIIPPILARFVLVQLNQIFIHISFIHAMACRNLE